MQGIVNIEKIRQFADSKCIRIDNMFYGDVDFNSPELIKARMDGEGQYGYNAGVVSFIIDGKWYATPFVEEALAIMSETNMADTGIKVPFGGVFDFPYKLSGERLKELWLKGYNKETGRLYAASNEKQYYDVLISTNGTFRKWNQLCKEAGKSVEDKSLEDLIREYIIDPIVANPTAYNSHAAEELGLPIKNSSTRKNGR